MNDLVVHTSHATVSSIFHIPRLPEAFHGHETTFQMHGIIIPPLSTIFNVCMYTSKTFSHRYERMVSCAHFSLKVDNYSSQEVVAHILSEWYFKVDITLYAQYHSVMTNHQSRTNFEVKRVKIAEDQFSRCISNLNNVHDKGIEFYYDARAVNFANMHMDPIGDDNGDDPNGLEAFIRVSIDRVPLKFIRYRNQVPSYDAYTFSIS